MNRLLGLILFFIGVGMVICLLVPDCVLTALAAAVCLLLGYQLFCC